MTEPQGPTKVLLIDDDRQELVLLEGLFSVLGEGRFQLDWSGSYEDGLAALLKGGHDVCLIDYRLLDERTGLDLLRAARDAGVRCPMILLTGLWDTAVDHEAMRAGAADYLVKGQFGPDLLERSLRYSIERARAVEALRESEQRYRAIVEGARALLVEASLKGRIARLNENARAFFGEGADALLRRHLLRLAHPKDRRLLAQALRCVVETGAPQQVTFRIDAPSARETWWFAVLMEVELGGKRSVAAVAQDFTSQRELEAMYVQSEKMSAMGFLAAGIAHELNTPLSVILGASERLLDAKPGRAEKTQLCALTAAAQRCRRLVEQMLAFSRKDAGQAERFDVCAAVRAAVSLVEPQVRLRSLDVVCDAEGRGVFVEGHRTQIEQLVINLANNAIDAMVEGGRLEVRAKRVRREGRPFARIEVIDTGRGIPPELLPKVVEPFFTTKAEGRGTGLGLSLASQIVARHGGRLDIDSKIRQGTTVTVHLPLAEAAR